MATPNLVPVLATPQGERAPEGRTRSAHTDGLRVMARGSLGTKNRSSRRRVLVSIGPGHQSRAARRGGSRHFRHMRCWIGPVTTNQGANDGDL